MFAAFVQGVTLPLRSTISQQQHSVSNRGHSVLGIAPIRAARLMMRANDSKARKLAPLVFATDSKGNPVWNLRSAVAEDAARICELSIEPSRLGPPVLESLFDGTNVSVVCEASVKGSKDGEGYSGLVLGAVAVDVTTCVRDPAVGFSSGLVKRAEILAAGVDHRMGEIEEVKQALLLGAMKKMKAAGVVQVRRAVAVDARNADEQIAMYTRIGFAIAAENSSESRGSKSSHTVLIAALGQLNPDPRRKIL
jgi:hypothetical protein